LRVGIFVFIYRNDEAMFQTILPLTFLSSEYDWDVELHSGAFPSVHIIISLLTIIEPTLSFEFTFAYAIVFYAILSFLI
jgi:hypothetical protein